MRVYPPERGFNKVVLKGDAVSIEGAANPALASEFARGLELGSNGLVHSVGVAVNPQDERQKDPADKTIERLVTTYRFRITAKYTPIEVRQASGEQ